MKDTIKIIEETLAGRAHQCAVVDADKVPFRDEVRKACEANYCGRYGKCWSCPPAVPPIDEMRKKYTGFSKMYVFTTKSDLEDCFDVEGMDAARVEHTKLTDEVIAALQAEGVDFAPLGAGSCDICEKCAYPASPCRFPDKMVYSVESVGIDVVTLSREIGINYINGENTVTYFSAVFF